MFWWNKGVPMSLPLPQQFKLARQRVYATFGIGGAAAVSIERADGDWAVRVEGRRVYVPSPLRWKLYRRGWAARLDQLEREYGVGRHAILGSGAVVLDVGANVGEFAHVGARYGARVYCLEPDPSAHRCLLRNIDGVTGASAHDILAWKREEELEFTLVPDRADSSVFAEGAVRVRRKATPLASFLASEGVAHVDLLKCDAEGAEPEVLEGLGATLPRVRVVALDTGAERRGSRTHVECRSILESHGFRVIDEKIGTRWMTYGLAPTQPHPPDEGPASRRSAASPPCTED